MANPLAELITEHCDRTGDTLSAIALRGGMSRQTLSGLVNRDGPRAFPRRQTLEALARGLDLPLESVRQVAAVAAYGEGDVVAQRRLVTALVAYAEGLSDDQLEVVLATARAVKRHARTA
jgi:transcriptional regulator with XRE-family HTH domain